MKTLAAVLMTTAALSLGTQASESLKAIVEAYLSLQSQLATDRLDDVKGPARAIAVQAAILDKNGAAIAKAANRLESAVDLAAARDAFGELTEAIMAAGKAEGWKDVERVRLAYCPMLKRSWLQTEEQIRNPYYGSKMLTCGEFKQLPK